MDKCPHRTDGYFKPETYTVQGYPMQECDSCNTGQILAVHGREPPCRMFMRALHEQGLELGRKVVGRDEEVAEAEKVVASIREWLSEAVDVAGAAAMKMGRVFMDKLDADHADISEDAGDENVMELLFMKIGSETVKMHLFDKKIRSYEKDN